MTAKLVVSPVTMRGFNETTPSKSPEKEKKVDTTVCLE